MLLASCQYQKSADIKRDVLVYCSEGSPQTFNPQLSTSGTTFDASSRTLYNRLVEFKPGTTQIQPALAESWSISRDGKEYTFKLRHDVQFHRTDFFTPTRPLNADDVIFSFERQWRSNHPFHHTSSFSYRYFESMDLGQLIASIEKLDDYTVKFVLTRAESPFLSTLAMDFASILSSEYAEQLLSSGHPEYMDSHPVGTGPFQLVRYQPDAYIRYRAHPDYWRGEQKLKNLVFAITPDPSLRFARMVAGECDVMANPLPVQVRSAANFDNIQVLESPGMNIAYLALNVLKPPFDNRKVRLALNHAINKQAIITAVYQKEAVTAHNPIPPNMWSYDKSIVDYEYDPELAESLLKQAGFEDGFTLNIWTMSAQRDYNPNAKKMAELIQQNLKDVGIRTRIETFEYSTFLDKVRHGEHQTALLGWITDSGDPDNIFSSLLSCASTLNGTNAAFWCDPQFSELIRQARTHANVSIRTRYYHEAQRIFKEEAPWVPIAHARQHALINPRVKNYKIIPVGGVNFSDVYLQEAW